MQLKTQPSLDDYCSPAAANFIRQSRVWQVQYFMTHQGQALWVTLEALL